MLDTPLKRFYCLPLAAGLTLFAAVGVSAAACPDTDAVALEWLARMSKSIREVSYQGVVTLQRGSDMQVMQVSHSVDHGRSSERLMELTGHGAEVKRDFHPLDCIHPGDQLLRVAALSEAGQCGIAEQYRFSVGDGERVAGRNVVSIKIAPRDMYRFGYVMSLDRQTGLLLKTQVVSHSHRPLETMQFAQLTYTDSKPEADSEAAVVHEAQHPDSASPSTLPPVARPWAVGWVPRGFTPTDSTLGTDGRRTYTDGLAVFSVFLEDLELEIRPGEGVVSQGSTTTYTRGMRLSGQPVLVTVIGEVPVNTARMVADSVSWVQ